MKPISLLFILYDLFDTNIIFAPWVLHKNQNEFWDLLITNDISFFFSLTLMVLLSSRYSFIPVSFITCFINGFLRFPLPALPSIIVVIKDYSLLCYRSTFFFSFQAYSAFHTFSVREIINALLQQHSSKASILVFSVFRIAYASAQYKTKIHTQFFISAFIVSTIFCLW